MRTATEKSIHKIWDLDLIKSNIQLIKEAKYYFGKDRKELKSKLLSLKYDGSRYRRWKKVFKKNVTQPFSIEHGIFDDVVKNIVNKRIKEINWLYLGDLSWKISIVLNKGVSSIFDNDKLLANRCGGTVRYLEVLISDTLPVFTYDKYYSLYEKENDYYQIGPLGKTTSFEKELIKYIKTLLINKGYFYINKYMALKKFKALTSDLNYDGNASMFDCLFRDTYNYQNETVRFNAKSIKIKGKYPYDSMSWKEFYTPRGDLIRREEYRFYKSNDVECVYTDKREKILKVKVWGCRRKKDFKEFKLNIFKT
jgi:hypothetical protein